MCCIMQGLQSVAISNEERALGMQALQKLKQHVAGRAVAGRCLVTSGAGNRAA